MDAQTHIIIDVQTGVRCGYFPSYKDAQNWLDSYQVSREYKEIHYRIVNANEYWERHTVKAGKGALTKPIPNKGRQHEANNHTRRILDEPGSNR